MSQLPVTQENRQLAVQPEPSTAHLLAAVVQGGVTADNVGAMERLIALKEREEARAAEREFAAAFAALQAEMPKVRAMSEVRGKDGNVKYTFAAYEEIMRQVRPLLIAHGFSLTYDTAPMEGGRIKVSCTLTHRGGHSRSNSFAGRIGSGPIHSSETQADGAAKTYCKRQALCDALNIVVEKDTDARDVGTEITAEQVKNLQRLIYETESDTAKVLAFAGAETLSEVQSVGYARAEAALLKKPKKRDWKEGDTSW